VLQFDGGEFLAEISEGAGPFELETGRLGGLRRLTGLLGQKIEKRQKLLPGFLRQRFNFGDDGFTAHGKRLNPFVNAGKQEFYRDIENNFAFDVVRCPPAIPAEGAAVQDHPVFPVATPLVSLSDTPAIYPLPAP
jgi:hypothetical protein